MHEIKKYLQNFLSIELQKLSLSEEQYNIITDDVTSRLEAIFSILPYKEKCASLLELTKEEAINYQPKNSLLKTRQIINLCIRNSIIEDIHADQAYTPIFKHNSVQLLDEEAIKRLTKTAITFFNGKFNNEEQGKIYLFDFQSSHPITFHAFLELSKLSSGTSRFTPIKSDTHAIEAKYNFMAMTETPENTQVTSGYDPTVDQELSSAIAQVKKDKSLLYLPFFKFLTRNTLKLYDIFEVILASGAIIVTSNYYLSNGLVCKRKYLLKVSHTVTETQENQENQKSLKGLCKEHRHILKYLYKNH